MAHICAVVVQALLSVAAAWDYTQNGRDWNDLGLCGGGGAFSKQSPVNLPSAAPFTDARQLFLKYPTMSTAVHLYNNGRGLAFTLPEVYRAGFGFVPTEEDLQEDGSAVFRLWQVSLHAPSEHTQAGRRYPLEMQLVHQRIGGGSELAVVSLLFEDGAAEPNALLAALAANGLPGAPWDEVEVHLSSGADGAEAGLQAAIAGSSFFGYEGSLTVPPCETGVNHFVRRDVVPASADQIRQFSAAIASVCPPNGNYRRAPDSSTAGTDLVLINSVDMLGVANSSDGQPRAGTGDSLADNADFQRWLLSDNRALREGKASYHRAELELRGARHDQAEAKRVLEELKAEQEEVGESDAEKKKDLDGKVAASEAEVAASVVRVASASQALTAATTEALKVYKEEMAKKAGGGPAGGIAAVKATTAAPTEFGSNEKVATTSIPLTFGVDSTTLRPTGPLQYPEPTVSLPRGPSANPFLSDVPGETEVSIGFGPGQSEVGGLSAHGSMRLAPNLRQLDGPDGGVEMPTRTGFGYSLAQGATRRTRLRSAWRRNSEAPPLVP